MQLIDGKAVAERIRTDLKQEVTALKNNHQLTPGLATVLVGDDPASETYIRFKRKACAEVGIESFHHGLPEDATQDDVEALVRNLNANPAVHGILVQLPLPKHLDEEAILNLIDISKDVDGFHPMNIGLLAMKGREPRFIPCTPNGIMVLLDEIGAADLSGKQAVVLGRSNIVGVPIAHLLLQANATVTIAHSRTQNLPDVCRGADVLVAAVGRPHMVKADWVKDGAIVIDVGINRIPDATRKSGSRLVGDVDFEAVKDKTAAITPVPGAVGPMTIAMLLSNTVRAAKASLSES